MAVHNMQVVNPNANAVTINGKTAPANAITKLQFDDAQAAPSDLFGFLAAGCAVTADDGSTFKQREDEGYLLHTGEPYATDQGQ